MRRLSSSDSSGKGGPSSALLVRGAPAPRPRPTTVERASPKAARCEHLAGSFRRSPGAREVGQPPPTAPRPFRRQLRPALDSHLTARKPAGSHLVPQPRPGFRRCSHRNRKPRPLVRASGFAHSRLRGGVALPRARSSVTEASPPAHLECTCPQESGGLSSGARGFEPGLLPVREAAGQAATVPSAGKTQTHPPAGGRGPAGLAGRTFPQEAGNNAWPGGRAAGRP